MELYEDLDHQPSQRGDVTYRVSATSLLAFQVGHLDNLRMNTLDAKTAIIEYKQ